MSDAGATAPAASGQGQAPATMTSTAGNTTSTGGTTTSSGAPPTDWTTGLTDELRGYVQTKGFKDAASVVDSYRNFEKLQGVPQERLLKLPEKDDDPQWENIYSRLGKPTAAKDYQIEVPKEFGDEGFADWAKQTFFELNMPKKQAETLSKKWNEYIGSKMQENSQERQVMVEQQTKDLKREWGAAFDPNIQSAKKAALGLGFDAKTIDALEESMGFAGVMKFMHSLGTKIGEHQFIDGSNKSQFGGALTPSQAKDRIAMLKTDPEFTKRYIAGETSPREEMDKLHRMAFPDLDE